MKKGDRFEGSWYKDEKEGKGTYYSASGNTFVGFWRQEKKHGMGEFTKFDRAANKTIIF